MPSRDPLMNTIQTCDITQERKIGKKIALQQGEISNLSFG